MWGTEITPHDYPSRGLQRWRIQCHPPMTPSWRASERTARTADRWICVPRSSRSASHADHGRYGFTCPGCRTEVTGSADRRVALLLAAGVEAQTAHQAPEEALAPEDRSPRPDAAAFTLDDVIDLHFLLDDDAWLEEELVQDREHELQR